MIALRCAMPCSLLLCVWAMAACSTAPAYHSSNWRRCYLGFEQEFMRYADQTRNCGYVDRESSVAQRRQARTCVRQALRKHQRFLIAKLLSGTDEWACEVIVGDQTGRISRLDFSGDLYTDRGQFEAFECQQVRIDGDYLSGVSAENCQAIGALSRTP